MAQWSSTENANSAPKYTVEASSGNKGTDQFNNTVFGVTTAELRYNKGLSSPGWVRTIDRGNGRTQYETLIAMGTISADDDEDVVFPDPAAPANTDVPTITGTAQEGQTLTANAGTWTGYPDPTFDYQWQLDANDISGATETTYTVTSNDVGGVIRVEVTATNEEGINVATSANTANVTSA